MSAPKLRASLEAAFPWAVPPRCQGQIVEVSYAMDVEGALFWRRAHDRSDRRSTYAYADARDYDLDWVWDPVNREPEGIDWIPVEGVADDE